MTSWIPTIIGVGLRLHDYTRAMKTKEGDLSTVALTGSCSDCGGNEPVFRFTLKNSDELYKSGGEREKMEPNSLKKSTDGASSISDGMRVPDFMEIVPNGSEICLDGVSIDIGGIISYSIPGAIWKSCGFTTKRSDNSVIGIDTFCFVVDNTDEEMYRLKLNTFVSSNFVDESTAESVDFCDSIDTIPNPYYGSSTSGSEATALHLHTNILLIVLFLIVVFRNF